MEITEGISVVLLRPVNRKDVMEGDKADGFRFSGLKINRGRRWKRWSLPAAVLRLERRSYK